MCSLEADLLIRKQQPEWRPSHGAFRFLEGHASLAIHQPLYWSAQGAAMRHSAWAAEFRSQRKETFHAIFLKIRINAKVP